MMKTTRHWNPLKLLAVLGVLVLVAGCGSTDLEPAPAADRVPGLDQAASATADGVRVVVQAEDWTGTAPIETTWQWLRDGTEIAGGKGATYALTAEDEGPADEGPVDEA